MRRLLTACVLLAAIGLSAAPRRTTATTIDSVPLHQRTVTIPHAQLQTLPITPVVIVESAVGLVPFIETYAIRMTRAPYTQYGNVGDIFGLYFTGALSSQLIAPYVQVRVLFEGQPFSQGEQTIIGHAEPGSVSFAGNPEASDWGVSAYSVLVTTGPDPTASYGLSLALDNYTADYSTNLGNLTGGDATDALTVTVVYYLQNLATGQFE